MYDPVHKAYSAAQHRLANFFETQTRFWKFGTWPEWAQDDILKPNKEDYPLRFNLFYFLTKNNLYPSLAKRWVLATDVDEEGELVFPQYPPHVWGDMSGLERKAKDRSLFLEEKPMMNMYEGHVTRQGDLSIYAPYERWITRRTGGEAEGKGDISRPTPRTGRQSHPAVQEWRQARAPRGVTYPPQPRAPGGRLTSSIRFIRTSRQGRGSGYYVTSYLGRDYRLN